MLRRRLGDGSSYDGEQLLLKKKCRFIKEREGTRPMYTVLFHSIAILLWPSYRIYIVIVFGCRHSTSLTPTLGLGRELWEGLGFKVVTLFE